MTREETLAYLAGFFDGEGCIHLQKTFVGKRGPYFKIILALSQLAVHQRPLQLMQTIFGGRGVRRDAPNSRVRPQMVWRMEGKQCKDVLLALFPYLIVKQPEAFVAISCIFHQEEMCKSYRQKSTDVETLNSLYSILKKLKRTEGMAPEFPLEVLAQGGSDGRKTIH